MRSELIKKFEDLKQENQVKLQRALDNGKKVVGLYCTYAPQELVLAAGAIPIGLCGTNEKPIPAAEKDLPRNLCPMVKSSYGFAATDTCPYFSAADMIIGETTCDGKKKMFEIMNEIKYTHVMNMPQTPDADSSRELWKDELKKTKEVLEAKLGVRITEDSLREAIRTTNREKRARKALYDLNKIKPAALSGTEMLKAAWLTTFSPDKNEVIEMISDFKNSLEELVSKGECYGDENTPRILLTGTPVGLGSEKVLTLVEECGGNVVCSENCTGYKTVDIIIPEDEERDVWDLLAESYMQIPCSVMSPNNKRLELIEKICNEFQIDGVIDLTWQACHTYNIESYQVEKKVKEDLNLPYLHIETDYSNSDLQNLKIRIAAFLEMIK